VCLQEVGATPLPADAYWRQWIVCDDQSTDGTIAQARRAAASAGLARLRIMKHEERGGKEVLLRDAHRSLLTNCPGSEVIVVIDADVWPEPQTFRELLQPLLDDPQLAVVWGDDRPKPTSLKQRPATFQAQLTIAMNKAMGPAVARPYGRLFAYRLGSLRDFTWTPHSAPDDYQFASFVSSRKLPTMSAWNATVQVTPAETFRDFYVQTYRPRFMVSFAESQRPPEVREPMLSGPTPRAILTGGLTALVHDPLGGVAYCVYRIAAGFVRRTNPDSDATMVAIAQSTKLPSHRNPGFAEGSFAVGRPGEEKQAVLKETGSHGEKEG